MLFLSADGEPSRLVKVEQTCVPLRFRCNSYAVGTQIPLLRWESQKFWSRSDFAFPTIYFGIKNLIAIKTIKGQTTICDRKYSSPVKKKKAALAF